MKNIRTIRLSLGLTLTLCVFTLQAHALPLLPFPTANDLIGPVFVQPFAGLAVMGVDGKTDPFFSDLPDGSLPRNDVINILGNFQAFDPFGAATPFNIVGVEVTVGVSTFTPAFGEFDFAGNLSVTFTDSVDFDVVTFSAGDFTLAFAFNAGPDLAYSYSLLTDLPVGSFLLYDDVETGMTPEPSTLILFGVGIIGMLTYGWRRRKQAS
ncbi:PEP-CTERM sorting domain-containing protein [Candidatus Poribacteria bacterium]|nr:PEP-CTERM sorting domain-containing protein [Candidatus Poribacteria bacterium]